MYSLQLLGPSPCPALPVCLQDDAIPRTESLELQDQEDLKRLKERGNHMFAAKLVRTSIPPSTPALNLPVAL